MSTFKNKNSLTTIEAQIVQKPIQYLTSIHANCARTTRPGQNLLVLIKKKRVSFSNALHITLETAQKCVGKSIQV